MNRRHVAFAITLFRGILAVGLGLALLIYPDKTRPMLVNFMGIFWLVNGLMSLRWGVVGQRAKGLWLVAGVIGVVAGVGMLSRNFVRAWVAEDVLISVWGLVIALTGALHMMGGFRQGDQLTRQWSWTAFLLGLFEMILGLLLVAAPVERGRAVYYPATLWALLGGFILIADALRVWRTRV